MINPKRKANGYREYSDEDIALLKKVIIFRKLGISIPDIRGIFSGDILMAEAVAKNIEKLNAQMKELNGALEICRIMEKDVLSKGGFDEERYWNMIQAEEGKGHHFAELIKDYVEFEKKTFIGMWGQMFFYDSDGSIKSYGFRLAFAILICFCLVRGLVVESFVVNIISMWGKSGELPDRGLDGGAGINGIIWLYMI